MNDKITSLVGFAVKADKVIYGVDDLCEGSRKRYLIICCHTISERSKRQIIKMASACNLPIIETKTKLLEEIVHKRNCKVIGIANKQMADAIIKYITEDYSVIKSEEI